MFSFLFICLFFFPFFVLKNVLCVFLSKYTMLKCICDCIAGLCNETEYWHYIFVFAPKKLTASPFCGWTLWLIIHDSSNRKEFIDKKYSVNAWHLNVWFVWIILWSRPYFLSVFCFTLSLSATDWAWPFRTTQH